MNRNVRVFYTKTGRAKYISHLDVNRCMQRNLKRSGLPCWYTEGFNPHLYLTFPLPISLGHESLCETMDLKVDDSVSLEEIKATLSSVLPEGFLVTRVDDPVMKPERIAYAEYEILLASDDKTTTEVAEAFKAFIQNETIMVDKKTKKGMNTIDIKPHILMRMAEPQLKVTRVGLRLTAGIMQTINPQLLLNAFFAANPGIYAKEITRMALVTEDGECFR